MTTFSAYVRGREVFIREVNANKYRQRGDYNRGAAWVDEHGKIYHCGMASHANVFSDVYHGSAVDASTVRDTIDDMWRVVRATDWIRALNGNFMVKRIDKPTLVRISKFLTEDPYYGQGAGGFFNVDDASGHNVRFFSRHIHDLSSILDREDEKPHTSIYDRLGMAMGGYDAA